MNSPNDVSIEWIQAYLRFKYPVSTFSAPVPFSVMLSWSQFSGNIVLFNQALFGQITSPLTNIIIGDVAVNIIIGNGAFTYVASFSDLTTPAITNAIQLFAGGSANVDAAFRKTDVYKFNCIEIAQIGLTMVGLGALDFQLLFNGWKVSKTS